MKISVCIATYNGGRFIREQVMSILPQLGEEDEMVVSDDGSTDDTIAILESFHDPRIKIFVNEGRHGFIWNFENALKHSSGAFVFLCDQDDVWKQDKVKVVIQALEKHDMVLHDAELVDQDGVKTGKLYSDGLHQRKGFWSNLWKTCGPYIAEVVDNKIREYCGQYLYEINGFLTHEQLLALITLLFA